MTDPPSNPPTLTAKAGGGAASQQPSVGPPKPSGGGSTDNHPAAGDGSGTDVPPDNAVDAARRRPLFWLSAAVLGVLFLYCGSLSVFVYRDSSAEREALRNGGKLVGDDYARYLLFSATMRPFELLATMRFVTVFLGFVLVVLGCLFILAYSPSLYKLRLDAGARSAALDTASPGLVLATLGAALVALALYRAADPKLDLPLSGAPSTRAPATPSASVAGPLLPPSSARSDGGVMPSLNDLFPGLGAAVDRQPATSATPIGSGGPQR